MARLLATLLIACVACACGNSDRTTIHGFISAVEEEEVEKFVLPQGYRFLSDDDCAAKIDHPVQWNGGCEGNFASGWGRMTFYEGFEIQGTLYRGVFEGHCELYQNGTRLYSGTIANLRLSSGTISFDGQGRLTIYGEDTYEGEIRGGEIFGYGSMYRDGEEYLRGRFNGRNLENFDAYQGKMLEYARQITDTYFDGGKQITVSSVKILVNKDGSFLFRFRMSFVGNIISSNNYTLYVDIDDSLNPRLFELNSTAQNYLDYKGLANTGLRLMELGKQIDNLTK